MSAVTELQPSYLRRHSALSDRRPGLGTRSDFVPEPGSADLLAPRAIPRSAGSAPVCTSPWRLGRTVGQHSMVMRPPPAEGHISHHADRLAVKVPSPLLQYSALRTEIVLTENSVCSFKVSKVGLLVHVTMLDASLRRLPHPRRSTWMFWMLLILWLFDTR